MDFDCLIQPFTFYRASQIYASNKVTSCIQSEKKNELNNVEGPEAVLLAVNFSNVNQLKNFLHHCPRKRTKFI